MTTTLTIHSGTDVPADNLATALPGPNSTFYFLYGFRGPATDERFTLIHDGHATGDGTDVILDNAGWVATWHFLGEILGHDPRSVMSLVTPPLEVSNP